MRGRMAALDAACARINPGLASAAFALATLDLAVAGQRWATAVRAAAPVPAGPVVAGIPADGCAPAGAPELRDMAGRD